MTQCIVPAVPVWLGKSSEFSKLHNLLIIKLTDDDSKRDRLSADTMIFVELH